MSAIFGEILTFGQPGGTEVQLKVFGDEHYARYETLDGFTAVQDSEKGAFCYARLRSGALQSTGVTVAEPPPAGLVRHLQEEQQVVEQKSQARRLRRAAMTGGPEVHAVMRTLGPQQGLLEGRVLSTGTVVGLTILVNFQDISSSVTQADVHELLNGTGYTRNGNICSATEFFERVSAGKLHYTNVVVGPYRLSRNRQFYVNNLLVEEALQLAVDDGLDLTQFDSRGDGIVDALNVLYAGQTQYNGDLWPHNHSIRIRHGQMRTDLYLLTSMGRTAADLSIGTFCHENGHLLCRFPDMYDYGERDGDSTVSAGIGHYCLMGAGNHLDFGRSPSPVCAYLRDLAGWCDVEVDLSKPGTFHAAHGDYNTVMKYRTSKPNEYFVIENRSKMDLDRAAAASGLAVYHCDTLGSNELQQGTATKHYQCALIQADGQRHLELNVNQGDGTDLFGAAAGVVLSNVSSPHSRSWDGSDSGLLVSDVTAPGPSITFTVGRGAAPTTVSGTDAPMAKIPDDSAAGVSRTILISAPGSVARVKVSVDIKHTYIGDLRVTLVAPNGRSTVLHAQLGGGRDDLKTTYDSASPGVLTNMVGVPMQGRWTLRVVDRAARDVGVLRTWSLELSSSAANVP